MVERERMARDQEAERAAAAVAELERRLRETAAAAEAAAERERRERQRREIEAAAATEKIAELSQRAQSSAVALPPVVASLVLVRFVCLQLRCEEDACTERL